MGFRYSRMVFYRCFANVVLVFSPSLNSSVVCCVSPHVVEFNRSCSRLFLFLLYVSSDFFVFDLFFFLLWNTMWLEKAKLTLVCGNLDRIRSRTPMSRLRNRQHAEEEDASALKLGTGAVILNLPVIPGLMVDNRV